MMCVDDVGVLSRDPYVLHQVVKVLLQQPELEWGSPSQVLVADDCFGFSTISSVRTVDLLARAVTETLGRRLITLNSCSPVLNCTVKIIGRNLNFRFNDSLLKLCSRFKSLSMFMSN